LTRLGGAATLHADTRRRNDRQPRQRLALPKHASTWRRHLVSLPEQEVSDDRLNPPPTNASMRLARRQRQGFSAAAPPALTLPWRGRAAAIRSRGALLLQNRAPLRGALLDNRRSFRNDCAVPPPRSRRSNSTRFNLTMRRTVDSGDQWRRQISAQTAAELALRAISCSFGLAANGRARISSESDSAALAPLPGLLHFNAGRLSIIASRIVTCNPSRRHTRTTDGRG